MSIGFGRCLVLGANGFIGSHMVDELADAGYKVRALDRYSRPEQFVKIDNVEVLRGDLQDPKLLADALKKVDYVFHCFSATTPYSSDNDPLSDVEKNLTPSIKIFEQCAQAKVKKVIFLSSGGAIYGQIAEEKPARETDAATPVSPYGINKLAIEGYLAYFKRKRGLDYVIYRLSNPYGPRQVTKNYQGVIPTFIQKMLQNEEVPVIGDGTSSRDYIYIRDATAMIEKSFESTQANIYNLGRGRQTSINEIISTLQGLIDTKSSVRNLDEPKTFLRHAGINTERFEQEFNLKALIELDAGLFMTLKSMQA